MTYLVRFCGILVALMINASVYAGDIQIHNAWARASAPGQDAGSVDMTITSKQAAALVGATSPASTAVELHSMQMSSDTNMMQMREVESIALPAGKPVNLAQAGYHLMLTGLKAPLKEGKHISLTLKFKVADRTVKIKTRAEIKSLTATMPPMDGM